MGSDLLTTQEVAKRLRVSVSTVSRWAHKGHLRAIRMPGDRGLLRFRQEDIDAMTVPVDEGAA